MKKVLIYQNRESGTYVWDVSTEELENKALISLFRLLDEEMGCYNCIREDAIDPRQIKWYKEAKKGDYSSLCLLLDARKDYEYEEWYVTDVEE